MYMNHLPPPHRGPKLCYAPGVPFCPPPCTCVDCIQQFRSEEDQVIDRSCYERTISDSEAHSIVGECARSINEDLRFLQDQCAAYGNTIRSRWKKKSRDKREASLLQVQPDMYLHLWFTPRINLDFPHWRKLCEYKSSWMLPYLSIEVLKDDHVKFLSLLYHRTRYTPQQWAPFDTAQLRFAWDNAMISTVHSPKCIVMTGSGYGTLTTWQKDAAHRFDIIGFPRGLMILQAQQHLMNFLRKLVEHLLTGVDSSAPGASDKWEEMACMGFKQTNSVEFWSPYLNQPFSAPPVFDINDVLSLVRTKLESAADHLWLLQTDPAYVRCAIGSLRAGATMEGAVPQDVLCQIVANS